MVRERVPKVRAQIRSWGRHDGRGRPQERRSRWRESWHRRLPYHGLWQWHSSGHRQKMRCFPAASVKLQFGPWVRSWRATAGKGPYWRSGILYRKIKPLNNIIVIVFYCWDRKKIGDIWDVSDGEEGRVYHKKIEIFLIT